MKLFAPSEVSPNRRKTPEGFLLCVGVPIARTGEMLYADGELGDISASRNGLIRVSRDEDVVFASETIASFEGKPVTIDHPDEEVSPDNWKKYSVGHVQNVRRGESRDSDKLLADLLITDASAIKQVESKKTEVSCGYDADFEQLSPGMARQTRIIGNHIALVEHGRCGPSCAIRDEEPDMSNKTVGKKPRTVWDRLRTAFKAKDEDAFNAELDEAEKSETPDDDDKDNHIHIHLNGSKSEAPVAGDPDVKDEFEPEANGDEGKADPLEERLAKIESAIGLLSEAIKKLTGAEEAEARQSEGEGDPIVKDEDPDKKDDEDKSDDDPDMKKVADSVSVSEFRETLSAAEILSPGIKLPVLDSKSTVKGLKDNACRLRRDALTRARDAESTRGIVTTLLQGRDIKTMDCASTKMVFDAATEVVKARRASDVATKLANPVQSRSADMRGAISSINAANRKFWSDRGGLTN